MSIHAAIAVHHDREKAVARAIDVHTAFCAGDHAVGDGAQPALAVDRTRGPEQGRGHRGRQGISRHHSRSWDADRRLQDMQADGVDVQVVSPMPELLSHWFPAGDADVLSGHINRAIAELCSAHPESFIGIGMVPVQDPALAARRLTDLKTLGLCGIELDSPRRRFQCRKARAP